MSAPDPRQAALASGRPLPPFREIAGGRCGTHADRAAAGVCRVCVTPSCSECLTRVDGVNHCARCLARLHPPRPEPPPPFRAFAARARMPRSVLRLLGVFSVYALVALLAATWGVAQPFFANERRLEMNRSRLTEVHLALSAYYNDVGAYPPPERGLDALLAASAGDREFWAGPYLTARSPEGSPAREPADDGRVLDVFGRPVLYYSSPVPEDESQAVPDVPEKVYIASPGGNGTWETAGVETGNAPREASGDDVLQWIAWP